MKFDFTQDPGPKQGWLKCHDCGFTIEEDPDKSYDEQMSCPKCGLGTQRMMGFGWGGWKSTPEREAIFKAQEEERRRKQKEYEIEREKPEFQHSESFNDFTDEERTIACGLQVDDPGTEAPWEGPYGVCMVKIYGIRRKNGVVEFGVGNETPPILDWVKADDFHYEWPD